MKNRPDWDQYFMSIAKLVSNRSTCIRRHVGAVIVKDKRILATGYNGAPSGLDHCSSVGCLREELKIPSGERHELCRGVHAEQNAIIQAAKHGIQVDGSELYSVNFPCSICAKMIINSGIKSICYFEEYRDQESIKLLGKSDIIYYQIKKW